MGHILRQIEAVTIPIECFAILIASSTRIRVGPISWRPSPWQWNLRVKNDLNLHGLDQDLTEGNWPDFSGRSQDPNRQSLAGKAPSACS
jgi:hypothetical protein